MHIDANEFAHLVTNDPYRMVIISILSSVILLVGLLIYRFIYPKRSINLFVLLILVSILPIINIFRPGIYNSGDLRTHLAQLMDFYFNLQQGIILPRWGGDLCGGYGCPTYQLEYILPYYVASYYHFLGFSFLTSLKLLLATSFIASGITMYLWAKDDFGEVPGFVAAIFYLFAPFHLIDLNFKGTVGEVLSFVFIPLLFLFAKRFIQTMHMKFFFLEAISVVCILLSHSSTTFIVVPIMIGYALVIWLYKNERKKLKELVLFLASIFYGMALSAAYWIPAVTEVKYTWWSTVTFGDFKPFLEYIYSPIAYGFLYQGHQGEYRLIIGYSQIFIILVALTLLFRNKIIKANKPLLIYFLAVFFFLFFMMLNISAPIWQNVLLLHTFIMVWRLLVPLSFVTAAIAAIIVIQIKRRWLIILLCFLTSMTTILNWGNRKMAPPLNNAFLTGDDIYTEYYEPNNPIYAKRLKRGIPDVGRLVLEYPGPLEFIEGKGKYVTLDKNQISHDYIIQATTDAVIKENTYYFPGWKVLLNNKEVSINYEKNTKKSFGKITFPIKKGLYKAEIIFTDTPIRNFANTISYISIIGGLLFLIIVELKNKNFFKNI